MNQFSSFKTEKGDAQNGNALWFILVAIVLLGALTILLTRSGSNVNQSGDVEQMRIKISQVIRWAKGIEGAVDQMKLRGVSESQISFENTDFTTNFSNPNCTTNDCKIFANGGGGLNVLKIPSGFASASEWIFTAMNQVGSADNPIGTAGMNTGNDLLLVARDIPDPMCKEIDREFSIGTSGTVPVENTEPDYTVFKGDFKTGSDIIIDGDDTVHELNGKAAGCFFDSTNGMNIFYYVLLAR